MDLSKRPAITAPVSRHLVVSNVDRAVAFYRDQLGFDARAVAEAYGQHADVELVCGPARLQIATGSGAHGSASLFFETDDVASMRKFVIAHGGAPSELARVNWIKMEMFEVRDPDGNVVWFGQSFQEPDRPAPPPMFLKMLPELPVTDVPAAVAYYRNVLGFQVNYAQDDIGVMERDGATVVLIPRTQLHTGIGSCYAYVADADALFAELKSRGANAPDAPVSMPWGLRQFHAIDPDGNRLGFGQPFE